MNAMSGLLAVALAAGPLAITATARADSPLPAGFEQVSNTIQVEHVTITVARDYDTVTKRIEASLGRFDPKWRELAVQGKADEARARLEEATARYGLAIHTISPHGSWLVLNGAPQKGVVYQIGNVLSATAMTRHDIGAGLYAPLRLEVLPSAAGGSVFIFDRPSSLFGQFGKPEIDKTARELDARLMSLIADASR